MGLFNIFKSKPDNFGIIAYNLTYIYYYIQTKYPHKFKNFRECISMAGTIDVIRYILKNEIETVEIENCLIQMDNKMLMNTPVNIEYNELHHKILVFSMNLQYVIFRVDSNFSSDSILNAIIHKQNHSLKWINKCHQEIKYNNFSDFGMNYQIENVMNSIIE